VYESATEGWRLGAHGRAAAALAARGASAAAQAHHIEQSAAHGDGAAIELLREAGDAAAPRSPAGAARWYAAALRLMPDAEREARLRVLIELAAAQRAVGDHENCCQSLLGAIELVAPDDVDLRVDLTARCAGSELFLGQHERAQRRLAEVSDALPDRGSRPAVVALLAQATAALFTSDHTRARDLAARALEHARSLRDHGLTGEAAATLAHAATIQGDIPLADSAQVEAATLLDGIADAALAAHLEAVHRFCRASLHLERYEDGVHHAQRGLRVALATGRGELVPVIKSSLAQCALMLGRLALATESQDAAIEGARLAGNDYVTCALLSTSANIASLKGDLEGALSAGEESVAIVAASAHGHILSVAKACLAVTMREAGSSRAHAEALVEPVGGWALTRLPAVWRVRHQEALTRIELGAGEVERAKECVRLAEAAAAELGMGVAKALAERARAAMLLASQEPVAAAELALASAAKADAAGARIEAASSRILAGRALAAAGERTRAIDLLREAEAELDDCGALSGRNHARRELRKLGARSEPRGPASGADSGLESLSAREREIAELVRKRKTNPEIAAQLYLSKKTVESHLRNIFMKLGASSRMEVALIVERARHEEEGAPVAR
jgi:DNA-binding NarL/FixJ family response regulator